MPGILDRLKTLAGDSVLSLPFAYTVLAVQQAAVNGAVYVLVAKRGNPQDPGDLTEFVSYRVDKPRECADGSYLIIRDGSALLKAVEVFRSRLQGKQER